MLQNLRKKSAHFALYEERNLAIALLLICQKGIKVNWLQSDIEGCLRRYEECKDYVT